MMGLLGQGYDDPRSSANMALAAGLLRGDLGGGLLGSNNAYMQHKQSLSDGQFQQMRLEEARMRMEQMRQAQTQDQLMRQAAQASVISPQKANAMSMGPMPDGSPMPQVQPGFDQQGFVQKMFAQDPLRALEFQKAFAGDSKPLTVAPGAALVDPRTMKPVFTNPKEAAQSNVAQLLGEMNQLPPGDPRRAVYENAIRKATTHTPGTNVNLSVNTEKSLLNEIAGGLGKGLTTAKDNAQSALGTINTVGRLMDALDSGQVMAGPGATFRQYGLQMGNLLGVTGQNAQEKLLNTRQAIQSLAQLELDAAQGMKGQGQITESERSIIRRAASGNIDDMTTQELRLLGGVLDRTARTKIRSFNTQVKPLATNPNAAAIAPFLNVEEPPERVQAPGAVRRYNPATGRIE